MDGLHPAAIHCRLFQAVLPVALLSNASINFLQTSESLHVILNTQYTIHNTQYEVFEIMNHWDAVQIEKYAVH